MNKTLLRIVALLLVPCLALSEAQGLGSFQNRPSQPHAPAMALFAQQALAEAPPTSWTPLLKQARVRMTQWGKTLLTRISLRLRGRRPLEQMKFEAAAAAFKKVMKQQSQ